MPSIGDIGTHQDRLGQLARGGAKMGAQHDATGRSKNKSMGDHGTFLRRPLMERPAWRAVSPKAQILYIWLRLEWKGAKYNNNGKIQLSCRQAAQRIGITINTANSAFHELQAKGFIVVTELGALGMEGEARGPSYELTELTMPRSNRTNGRKLYRNWAPGRDFPVVRHSTNNPTGKNGISKNPSSNSGRTHPESRDVSSYPVTNLKRPHHQDGDVLEDFASAAIIKTKTSLVTIPEGTADTVISGSQGRCDRKDGIKTNATGTKAHMPTSQMISPNIRSV